MRSAVCLPCNGMEKDAASSPQQPSMPKHEGQIRIFTPLQSFINLRLS
ncbi:hypothetical protein HMPREF1546_01842 [Oscillibacter sp. KLE 1745]|nr:hypothetical protein HMPREF1546_01842 [Oscillibacter sp. KLE 1745]